MALLDTIPQQIAGPAAWLGRDLASGSDWIELLSDAEVAEIEYATNRLVNASFDIASIRQIDFPLPTVGPRLRQILDDVLNGRGFVLVRRLPVERWTLRQSATGFFGIGPHLGSARLQNAQGHVLGHVRGLGQSSSAPDVRIYQTHERQGYHADACDVVGLLCLRSAKVG